MQHPLSQSEASDAHLLRFKLANQSISALDIMCSEQSPRGKFFEACEMDLSM